MLSLVLSHLALFVSDGECSLVNDSERRGRNKPVNRAEDRKDQVRPRMK